MVPLRSPVGSIACMTYWLFASKNVWHMTIFSHWGTYLLPRSIDDMRWNQFLDRIGASSWFRWYHPLQFLKQGKTDSFWTSECIDMRIMVYTKDPSSALQLKLALNVLSGGSYKEFSGIMFGMTRKGTRQHRASRCGSYRLVVFLYWGHTETLGLGYWDAENWGSESFASLNSSVECSMFPVKTGSW